MSKNAKHHADDGPIGLLDQDDLAVARTPRLRRVAATVGHGAGEVRRVAAATTAGAAQAFEAAEVGPKVKQRAAAVGARAARVAADHPIPSVIGAAYVAGFLKGHRVARRRRRR